MTQYEAEYMCANLLLASHRAFIDKHDALGMALLVKAEQRIADVEDPVRFLRLQCHADVIWRDHAIHAKMRTEETAAQLSFEFTC